MIPEYYDTPSAKRGSDCGPLLVAPLGEFQDTLLVGPRDLADNHDAVVGHIYDRVLPTLSERWISMHLREYRDFIILAVSFVTGVRDDFDRCGLAVTCGVVGRRRVSPETLGMHCNAWLQLLRRQMGLELRVGGADGFLRTLQESAAQAALEESTRTFMGLKHDEQGIAGSLGWWQRWMGTRYVRARRREAGRAAGLRLLAVVCPPRCSLEDQVELFCARAGIDGCRDAWLCEGSEAPLLDLGHRSIWLVEATRSLDGLMPVTASVGVEKLRRNRYWVLYGTAGPPSDGASEKESNHSAGRTDSTEGCRVASVSHSP